MLFFKDSSSSVRNRSATGVRLRGARWTTGVAGTFRSAVSSHLFLALLPASLLFPPTGGHMLVAGGVLLELSLPQGVMAQGAGAPTGVGGEGPSFPGRIPGSGGWGPIPVGGL